MVGIVIVCLVDALDTDKETVLVNQASLQECSHTFVLSQDNSTDGALTSVPHLQDLDIVIRSSH